MKPLSTPTAYLLISHGSRDMRPAQAMSLLRSMVAKRLSLVKAADRIATDLKDTDLDVQSSPNIYVDKTCEANWSGDALPHCSFLGGPTSLTPKSYQHSQHLSAEKNDLSQQNASVSLLAKDILTEVSNENGIEVQRLYHKMYDQSSMVETACLELAEYPLHHQIYQLGLRLIAIGVHELKLVPIFLMAGTHVTQDIPSEIEIAQSLLGDALNLTICDHLGAHPAMPDVLAKRLASLTTEGSLLIAHGSRRQKGNKAIQNLAGKINTPVAYWAVPPDIESQVIALMQQGCQGITILPYFLFAGGITDAIAHRTEELAERFPKVTFRLLPPLGATEEIADLIVDLL